MRSIQASHSLSKLAEQIGSTVVGDPSLVIQGLSSLETLEPHHITFIRSKSSELVAREVMRLKPHTAAIVPSELSATVTPPEGASLLLAKDSYESFLNLIPLFYQPIESSPGIHPTAIVDPTASLGASASIGPFCVIGKNVSIGEHVTLHAHVHINDHVSLGNGVTLFSGVVVRDGCQIKDRVTVHNNAVIGADGFGYTPDAKTGLRKVPQLGIVVIDSDVEIGANTCIDRGAFGPTRIGKGTKIDNLVQIGHNVSIGSFCIICGSAAIGGSTTIADGVVVGGKTGIADHLRISSGVRIGGGSGVVTSLDEPGDYVGYPAIKAQEWRRQQIQARVRNKKPKKRAP